MASNDSGKKKGRFYCEEVQFVVFQVEDVIQRVPRYGLTMQSEMFRDMFELPQGDGASTEGTSEENPIKVPDWFTNFEFESLMEVVYGLSFKSPYQPTSNDTLLGALRLASHWQMLGVVEFINTTTAKSIVEPTEKVVLGMKYKIPKLLAEGYLPFVVSAEPIPLELARTLGWEALGQISYIQNKLFASSHKRQITVKLSKLTCDKCAKESGEDPYLHSPKGKGSPYSTPATARLKCSKCYSETTSVARAKDWSWVELSPTELERVEQDAQVEIRAFLERVYETTLDDNV